MKHNMRIGCCSVVFRNNPIRNALGWIAEAGFENVEVEANYSWCNHADIHKDDPIAYKTMVNSYGLKLTSMSVARELIAPWELHYDAVEDLKLALRWAKAAGAACVVTGEGRKPSEMSIPEALESVKRKLEQIVPVTEETGVYLCFEPHGELSLCPGGLRNLLNLVPSKMTGVNFDTGNPGRGNYIHAGAEENVWMLPMDFPKHDECDILRPVVDRVRNVHMKDCIGIDAVCLGTGNVNLQGVVSQLYGAAYDGVINWQTEGFQDEQTTKQWMKESKALIERMLAEVG